MCGGMPEADYATGAGSGLKREVSATPSIPSLAVDYDEVDAADPEPDVTFLQRLSVFGFSERARDDPRYKALAKLKLLTEHHGVGDLKLVDYYRAFLVYSAASDKVPSGVGSGAGVGTGTAATTAARTAASTSAPELPTNARSYNAPRPARRAKSARGRTRSFWSWGATSITTAAAAPMGSETAPAASGDRRAFGSAQWTGLNGETARGDQSDAEAGVVHSNEGGRTFAWDDCTVSADQVRLMYHMLRHAESIYGLPITIATAPLVSLRRLSGRAITTARNGLSQSDVVHSRFTASTFKPAHYVAVDRGIQAVLVCIRGTANLLDSLTDVAATYDPLTVRRMLPSGELSTEDGLVSGYGHAGVLRSARNLFGEIRDATLGALRQNPGYELLLTGHSLGGAIASVLSLIMRDDDAFPHALAVSIAPPPCLSWELAEETTTTALTLVNGSDIVPRLSIPVLLPYLATARYVADLSPTRRHLVGAGFASLAVQWTELSQECEKRVEVLRQQHHGKQLYIPGAVFHMLRTRASWNGPRTTQIVPVDRSYFVRPIARERGMLTAHAPLSYRAKLNSVLRHMGAPKLPTGAGKGTSSAGWTNASMLRMLTRVPVRTRAAEQDTGLSANGRTASLRARFSGTGAGASTSHAESVDGVVKDLFQRGLSLRRGSLPDDDAMNSEQQAAFRRWSST